MPEDSITARLRAALDSAEHQALEFLAEVQRVSLELQEPKLLGSYQPGWYSWPKVEALVTDRIRLVARDRALLADLDEAQKAMDRAVLGFGLGDVFEGELIAVTARLKALREEVKRAAEFWLGPEVPDADH